MSYIFICNIYIYIILVFLVNQGYLTTIKRGGNPAKVYSNSCPSQQDNDELLLDVLKFLSIEFGVNTLGLDKTYAATSCDQITSANPQSKAGMYWITNGTTIEQKYCYF